MEHHIQSDCLNCEFRPRAPMALIRDYVIKFPLTSKLGLVVKSGNNNSLMSSHAHKLPLKVCNHCLEIQKKRFWPQCWGGDHKHIKQMVFLCQSPSNMATLTYYANDCMHQSSDDSAIYKPYHGLDCSLVHL